MSYVNYVAIAKSTMSNVLSCYERISRSLVNADDSRRHLRFYISEFEKGNTTIEMVYKQFSSIKGELLTTLQGLRRLNANASELKCIKTGNKDYDDQVEDFCSNLSKLTENYNKLYNKYCDEFSLLLNNGGKKDFGTILEVLSQMKVSTVYENIKATKNKAYRIEELLLSITRNEKSVLEVEKQNFNYIEAYKDSLVEPNHPNLVSLGKKQSEEKIQYNDLVAPEISIDEINKYGYRAHKYDLCSKYSKDKKKYFTDDEYAYQEFLAYLYEKMISDEFIVDKLSGLRPEEKQEIIQQYVEDTIKNLMCDIAIRTSHNGNLEVYLMGNSANVAMKKFAAQYILRVNGYDIERSGNLDKLFTSFSDSYDIKKVDKLNHRDFSTEFSGNFKVKGFDLQFEKILEDGKGLRYNDIMMNANSMINLKRLKDIIESEKEIGVNLKMAHDLIYYINLAASTSYDLNELCKRNLMFSDEVDKFKLLVEKNKMFKEFIHSQEFIEYDSIINQNEKVTDARLSELRNHMCSKIDELLDISENIVQVYNANKSENTNKVNGHHSHNKR